MAGIQLRGSCDDCHLRKVRCVGTANGCRSCQYNGRQCQFSPRSQMGRPRTRSSSTALEISNHVAQANASPVNASSLTTLTGIDDWNFTPAVCDESPFSSSEGQNLQAPQPPVAEMENPMLSRALEPLNEYFTPASSTSSHSNYQSTESYPFQRTSSNLSLPLSIEYHGREQTLHAIDQFVIPSNHTQLCPVGDPLLDTFLELSNLQFDLHHQRDQLTITGPESKALNEVPGLASILQTSSAICTIAHSILRRAEGTNVDLNPTRAPRISGTPTNEATLLLMLTIILEDLKLFEELVRISLAGNQNSANVELGQKFGYRCSDSNPASSDPCSFFINLNAGSGSASSFANALLVSSLTSYTNLNQVLVLTVMDFQLSSFGRFLHYFKDCSVGPNVASSLVDGRKKMRQVRQDLRGILVLSQKPWDH